MFVILAVVILGSAIMCVATKRIMRAATYLLFVLFGVAGVFFLLDYTYLGAAQIAVYAGGITILYVFAIQLVSKRTLQGLLEHVKGSKVIGRALVCLVGFVTLAVIVLKNHFIDLAATVADTEVPMDQIGSALVGADKYGYVLPFEFISVCIFDTSSAIPELPGSGTCGYEDEKAGSSHHRYRPDGLCIRSVYLYSLRILLCYRP